MGTNRYFKLWWPIIGLHALHQLEESIGFFQWYLDTADKIPHWLLILDINNARRAVEHPEYFVLASIAQISAAVIIAWIFRGNEKITKILIGIYILGLSFFLIWHIVASFAAHSYAPVLVTCFAGLYLIPKWLYQLTGK